MLNAGKECYNSLKELFLKSEGSFIRQTFHLCFMEEDQTLSTFSASSAGLLTCLTDCQAEVL